ncbi:cohesin loading factor-domain-containing protein [Pestalotiopsis sp. NC0098]|nr:cohesin loading factor-domain-containing protein [Pestalotiopsis sp. NC0098]
MTYRGSLPGSGYGQNQGQPWPQQQNMQQSGFDAYGNPHAQYPQYSNQQFNQYQNAVFAPIGVPQQTSQTAASYVGVHPSQYQNYDPSFDQRPQQSQQYAGTYGAQMGQMNSVAQQPIQQQAQRPSNQYMPPQAQRLPMPQQQPQQSPQQHQQYQQPQAHAQAYSQQQHFQAQQQQQRQSPQIQHVHQIPQSPQQGQPAMGWQQMPPPSQSPMTQSPMAQYQSIPPQAIAQKKQTPQPQQQQLQQQQQPQQPHRQKSISSHANSPLVNSPHVNSPHANSHANSPVPMQSPQLAQQSMPIKSRSVSSTSGRIDEAARVSASPRMAMQNLTRSPSVSSVRSPAPTPGLIPHQDTNSLLVCVAEEMFTKARESVLKIADSLDSQAVQEYHKMIATGLGCLESVLASNKLQPKFEAKVRLRYASILCEETNNIMEAETALSKGITLCEKYRFVDLKYLMQFMQLRMLSQRKGKAVMIAVDQRISDANLSRHFHWVYALRFFKATLYLQSSNPSDIHASENLRAIMTLAQTRGDTTIFQVACLLDGLGHLKSMRDDVVDKIQNCIAQAQKYQLDSSPLISQVETLLLMLDFACSLRQKSPKVIFQKLKLLQSRMDDTLSIGEWGYYSTEVLLPINKQTHNVNQTISSDTHDIIRVGQAHQSHDWLVMSFWTKIEAFILTYTVSGLGQLHGNPRNDKRIIDLWEEALKSLVKNAHKLRSDPTSLQEAIKGEEWRRYFRCYLLILRGLHLATISRWPEVWKCVEELDTLVKSPLEGVVGLYSCYLSGVYHQGTGNLASAKSIYEGALLSLENNVDENGNIQGLANMKQGHAELEVRVLSAFNRIWIMQHPDHRDDPLTTELIELLRPLCLEHPNIEIRTAFNLILAATQTSPPIGMTAAKNHLAVALNGARALGDVHTLSIALNLMRSKLFQNIVGDQALKSAKAGASQARRAGNKLWMSVAEGLLAQSYEVQGQMVEARQSWDQGATFAADALGGAPPPTA